MSVPLANLLFAPENWMFIALLGLILFGGKRLPEMGRSLGKGITEFKKGLSGVEEEMERPASQNKVATITQVDRPVLDSPAAATPGYKFDPYTGKPIEPTGEPVKKFDPYTGKPLE